MLWRRQSGATADGTGCSNRPGIEGCDAREARPALCTSRLQVLSPHVGENNDGLRDVGVIVQKVVAGRMSAGIEELPQISYFLNRWVVRLCEQ